MNLRVQPRAAAQVVRQLWRHPANRGVRLRKLSEALAFQARGRILGRPSRTEVGTHSQMWVHLHSGAAARALYANPPDWREMHVWRQFLRPHDLFIDVGAHVGLYTIWALDCGAEVIAVEPNPESLAQLKANLHLNGYQAEVFGGALSEHAGEAVLAGPDLARQHLVMGVPGDLERDYADVTVSTLDRILGDRVAAGVKIDVEGAEFLVLEGGRRALEQHRIRLLQIEWNDCSLRLLGQDRSSTAEMLVGMGYKLFRPGPDFRLRALDDAPHGADIFAMPAELEGSF